MYGGKIFVIYEQTENSNGLNSLKNESVNLSIQHASNAQDFLSSDIGHFSIKTDDMKDELTYRERSVALSNDSDIERNTPDMSIDIRASQSSSIHPYYNSHSRYSQKSLTLEFAKLSVLDIFFKHRDIEAFIINMKLFHNIQNENRYFNERIISLYLIFERYCMYLNNTTYNDVEKNELLKQILKKHLVQYKSTDKVIAGIYKLTNKLTQCNCLQKNILVRKILQKTYGAYARHSIRNFVAFIHSQTNQNIKLI